MNMFEEAAAIMGTMRLCRVSQTEMARRLGVSQSYIANKLRLLKLDPETKERIVAAGLTERHARTLLRLDADERRTALDRICRSGLNVAETEALVDSVSQRKMPHLVGTAERHRRIDVFKDALRSSVATLASLGVDVRQSTSTHAGKTYITLSIDERQ